MAALLFSALLVLAACGGVPAAQSEGDSGSGDDSTTPERAEDTQPEQTEETQPEATEPEGASPEEKLRELAQEDPAPGQDGAGGDELEGFPEFRGWEDPSSGDSSERQHVGTDSSSGAIPAVKPFNFGRDPGGPEDKTLYLTVPSLELEDVPIYDSVEEEKLTESAVHVPATGFPWQEGANTFIAGHRVGYPGTGSDRIFYDLDQLTGGEEIILRDADGGEYVYEVTSQVVVGPMDTEVMNPMDDKSVVSLQTCTLPDYKDRIVVQGDLVSSNPA